MSNSFVTNISPLDANEGLDITILVIPLDGERAVFCAVPFPAGGTLGPFLESLPPGTPFIGVRRSDLGKVAPVRMHLDGNGATFTGWDRVNPWPWLTGDALRRALRASAEVGEAMGWEEHRVWVEMQSLYGWFDGPILDVQRVTPATAAGLIMASGSAGQA